MMKGESGQALVEYTLLLALLAVCLVGAGGGLKALQGELFRGQSTAIGKWHGP